MQNFLKIIVIILTVLIAVISALFVFVFDFVNLDEAKDLLEKFVLLLAILSLGSMVIGYISKK